MRLEQVDELFDWLDENRQTRQSCRIVGESRIGKTTSCVSYAKKMKEQGGRRSPIVPVVYITSPPNVTHSTKDLFVKILDELRYRAVRGTIADLRRRTYEVLKACEVEMLIIDEANQIKREAFLDVRNIDEELNIPVVLVGTDRLNTLIRSDEQMWGRFRFCYSFGLLEGEEFIKTLAIWEEKVLKLPVPSNLTSTEMVKILRTATEGYIGHLDAILKKAAVRSLSRGFKRIEKSVLQEVIKTYVKH